MSHIIYIYIYIHIIILYIHIYILYIYYYIYVLLIIGIVRLSRVRLLLSLTSPQRAAADKHIYIL